MNNRTPAGARHSAHKSRCREVNELVCPIFGHSSRVLRFLSRSRWLIELAGEGCQNASALLTMAKMLSLLLVCPGAALPCDIDQAQRFEVIFRVVHHKSYVR
jgi:hypothetical protein